MERPGFSGSRVHEAGVQDIPDIIYGDVVKSMPSLANKCIAITGCTSGTGFWMALAAVRKGAAALLMLNRQSKRAEAAEAEVKKYAGSCAVQTIYCDLVSLQSVRAAAKEVEQVAGSYGGLDVLANNAGIIAMADVRTGNGFDVQMQVNHLSHFLLTSLLMSSLEQAAAARGEARVVSHSSGARFFSLGKIPWGKPMEACPPGSLGGDSAGCCLLLLSGSQYVRYAHSKLANVVFAMALHDRLKAKSSKVKSLVCEPGGAATSLAANGLQTEGGKQISEKLMKKLADMGKGSIQSGGDGACPLITACFGADSQSGDLFCPCNINPPKIGLHLTGMPIKTIAGGAPCTKNIFGKDAERRGVDSSNKDILWQKSEAAIGEKFKI